VHQVVIYKDWCLILHWRLTRHKKWTKTTVYIYESW